MLVFCLDLNFKNRNSSLLNEENAVVYRRPSSSKTGNKKTLSDLSSQSLIVQSRENEETKNGESLKSDWSSTEVSNASSLASQPVQGTEHLVPSFCKYCVNELTVYQIGFDEAIQLCTNVNVRKKNFCFFLRKCPVKCRILLWK